jgi:hypothetical protein
MTLNPVDPLWRPNGTGPAPADRDDRDLIRQYAKAPATYSSLETITICMNTVASNSPSTVARVQAWIDEIEDLETTYATQVASGTAHLGNVEEYEGLRPGYEPTRQDLVKKADVLEWDIESLARVRIKTGGGAMATTSGVLWERINQLKGQVLQACSLGDLLDHGSGTFMLERS